MEPEIVLATLRAHWDEIWESIDERSRAALAELVADTTGDPTRVARRIIRLVLSALPDGHPVRGLFGDSVRFTHGHIGIVVHGDGDSMGTIQTGAAALLRSSSSKAGATPPNRIAPQAGATPPNHAAAQAGATPPDRATPPDGAPPGDSAPPPDADDWLLAADSVSAADYRAGGHDPGDPDLIRLTDRQGTVRLPAFQFDGASGRPLPVVVAVNRLLDADDDPWGVADWWLGANAWLEAVPARLLGTTGEHALLAAARAEIAEW
ncbi:hypothetical protein ABTX81_19485 [Kitasatospora sp. NPDC097605]|uniref:hypothetical protein n=1 Tax=Kitasatospora sp. NPDC097605 TaxID=3157226 RepID=UPI0033303281